MNKIILSSAALHRILYELITPLIPEQDDYEIEVCCKNKQLSFGKLERTLDVESKSDWSIEIRIGQLRKLFRILTNFEEQPLVISFQNSQNWIEIFNVLI